MTRAPSPARQTDPRVGDRDPGDRDPADAAAIADRWVQMLATVEAGAHQRYPADSVWLVPAALAADWIARGLARATPPPAAAPRPAAATPSSDPAPE